MQRHAHVEGSRRVGPQLRMQGPLSSDGGSDGAGSGGKGGLNGVTDRLEQHAPMSLDLSTQQREVAINSVRHRQSVSLPQRRAALDIGEEEGDGAGGEFGHDPFQSLSSTWCRPIVAYEQNA